ncbi:MAG: M23 family metallopeptidase [Alphaproteobacteria bacterium]|nr:M23 family metallopeptidase [Alphaproteobacteria bacterium]
MKRLVILLVLLTAAPPARAADLALGLPLDCQPGRDCWIIQYPDLDPGSGWRDHTCGRRSYDGHSGTDFGIPDLAAMARGVPVLAAAAGRVEAVRDGMKDRRHEAANAKEIAGRECGNAVRLSHGDGWQTLYCHLREGSVTVHPGDTVEAGAKLGLVGMSGAAEFPHVHFQVIKNDQWIDPFLGKAPAPAVCGGKAARLWQPGVADAVAYSGVDITNIGFSSGPPEAERILAGDYDGQISRDSTNLTLWARVHGAKAGDKLRLRLTAPDGAVLADSETVMPADKIRVDLSIGRDKTAGRWLVGAYRGEVTIARLLPDPLNRRAEAVLRVEP